MRLEIKLNRTSKQRMLPMDYQYYISAWIYKVLKQADADFANFLHEKGYGQSETKLYKLFCFSRLNFGKPKMWKEKKLFEISAHEISIQVSFDVNEVATNFIKGLFMAQEFYLGDKFNGIDFKVSNVAALSAPEFTQTMHYRLQTPWVIGYKTEADRYTQYLRPYDKLFYELTVKHIAEKYNSTHEQQIELDAVQFKMYNGSDEDGNPIYVKPEPEAWLKDSKYWKRSGMRIKNHSKSETKVLGNLFDFELTAPIEIHQMIWNAGVSEKSSNGFGWLELQQISDRVLNPDSTSDRVFTSDRVLNSVRGKKN